MSLASPNPLSDHDRAILRAVLAPMHAPRPGSEPTSLPPESVTSALAAAGLDDLDLPLWFAQPHIQDYISAHRALEDFLDEQASRAARRAGLDHLHALARTTDSPDATCHDLCRPRHSRASPSPNPRSIASATEQRLIATALLRADQAPRRSPPRRAAACHDRSPPRNGRAPASTDPRPIAPSVEPIAAPADSPAALRHANTTDTAPAPTHGDAIRAIDDAIARILAVAIAPSVTGAMPDPPPRPAASRDTG